MTDYFRAIRPSGPKWATVIILGMLVIGCGSRLANLADADLQEKVFECNKPDLAPGMAIQCDNYRRECARRREQGRFVC